MLLNASHTRLTDGLFLAADDQIPLVYDNDYRTATLVRVAGYRCVEGAHPFRSIDHQQGNVRRFEMLPRHNHGKFLRHQVGLSLASDAGSVDKAEPLAIAFHHLIHRVAGSAGNGRDNGPIRMGNLVQKCGFANIVMADDGHANTRRLLALDWLFPAFVLPQGAYGILL